MSNLTGLTVAQVEHLLDRLHNKTTDELVELLDFKQISELQEEWLADHRDVLADDLREPTGDWANVFAKRAAECAKWIGEQVERLFQDGKIGVPDSWLPEEEEIAA